MIESPQGDGPPPGLSVLEVSQEAFASNRRQGIEDQGLQIPGGVGSRLGALAIGGLKRRAVLSASSDEHRLWPQQKKTQRKPK